jgi:pyruvate-ferredoxin/flavodoxin oxidoreductase
VVEQDGAGAAGTVAVATGMALAGLRATAFLRGEELVEAHPQMRTAAARLVPLVLHVANRRGDAGSVGHTAYHAVADTGFFQMLAHCGQHALDLTLLARWVAERAMVPGLVAVDGQPIEDLRLPDEELVRTFLGWPEEPVASATAAQQILFGQQRRRLLAWFDPDHPVATGGMMGASEATGAASGRQRFFADHLREIAELGMAELAKHTERPLSFVDAHHTEDAELVLVTQGAMVPVARAVADHLRQERGWKVGVLGITWLRPFPAREVAAALRGRTAVAVIEQLQHPLHADPPLLREVCAAVGSRPEGWVSAVEAGTAAGHDSAHLLALCELLRKPDRPRWVRLDTVVGVADSGLPRRDALDQAVRSAYDLDRDGLPPMATDDLTPEGAFALALVGSRAQLPPDALTRLATTVEEVSGPVVRGVATEPVPGALLARVQAAGVDFANPGVTAPVPLLVVAAGSPERLGDPLSAVQPEGTVVVATQADPEQVWAAFPATWKRWMVERRLRLALLRGGFDACLEVIASEDPVQAEGLVEVDWRTLPSTSGEPDLPQIVRRIDHARPAQDSLPRFFGEVVQPRQSGATIRPDPLVAAGAVPAGASALQPAPANRQLPVLDPNLCTGCAKCWVACPDSAIGVTALSPEALLTAASRQAGTEGKGADALRRSHKHLARRVVTLVKRSETGAVTPDILREAYAWLTGRMSMAPDERGEWDAAFTTTLASLRHLSPMATPPLFHDAEREQKGSGDLLLLAIDPHACQGCNLCVAECPEEALAPAEPARAAEAATEAREQWHLWEALPDTSGTTIARAAAHPDLDPLAAALLSRHCAQAQTGGGTSEPGSGERLATRLVTALAEYHAQRQHARLLETIDQRREALERWVRAGLAEGIAGAGAGVLANALDAGSTGRLGLTELGAQLERMGSPVTVDRQALRRASRLVDQLEALRHRIAEGPDGLGRARFGVVVSPGTVAELAAWPDHPWFAPLVVEASASGVELARGIAQGLMATHLEAIRTLRRAELVAAAPKDLPTRLDEVDRLGWADLTDEERASCPPLLLFGGDHALLEHGFGVLTRLLESGLAVKVVLLDGLGRLDRPTEPALVAASHRTAFSLSSSLAHPGHLGPGLADAFAFPGPAFVHLHAPSPSRHGFPSEATVAQARRAVEGRAHLLFRYDPRGAGLFGTRTSVEGNPEMDSDWGGATFAEWACSEARFTPLFEQTEDGTAVAGPEVEKAGAERLAIWSTLRELTGLRGPFTERIRAEVQEEVAAEHQKQLDALGATHQAEIAEIRSGFDREAVDRLTKRLMTLAGHSPEAGGGQ